MLAGDIVKVGEGEVPDLNRCRLFYRKLIDQPVPTAL